MNIKQEFVIWLKRQEKKRVNGATITQVRYMNEHVIAVLEKGSYIGSFIFRPNGEVYIERIHMYEGTTHHQSTKEAKELEDIQAVFTLFSDSF